MFKTNSQNSFFSYDDGDIVEAPYEDWRPTQQAFDAFIARDAQLANENIRSLLLKEKQPVSMKSIRECVLHSQDTIERVVNSMLANKQLVEIKGSYTLTGLP